MRLSTVLLLLGVLLIVAALLGFGGIVLALRAAAWLFLVAGAVLVLLSFLF
jgi:hypothetical protein